MTIFLCGQDDIAPNTCPECDGWMGANPVSDPAGMRFCSQECITDNHGRRGSAAREAHLHHRDLMCDCAEVCAPAGRPTQAERDEWAEYLRQYGGVR